MPAFLTRDGESLPQGMPPAREQVRCTKDGCEVSYTFRSDAPATMHGREKTTKKMDILITTPKYSTGKVRLMAGENRSQ